MSTSNETRVSTWHMFVTIDTTLRESFFIKYFSKKFGKLEYNNYCTCMSLWSSEIVFIRQIHHTPTPKHFRYIHRLKANALVQHRFIPSTPTSLA